MIHTFNILLHVIAGTIALIIGTIAICFYRRPKIHRLLGKIFLWLLIVVVASGFFGWLFFRSDPFLLMLTLISGYVGFAGWRVIRLRIRRPPFSDGIMALVILSIAIAYLHWLPREGGSWSPVV